MQCDIGPSQVSQADGAQQPDGTWARTGEYIAIVSKDSALLGLPKTIEEEVAAEGNHSTMVKFSSQNHANYIKALGSLHKFEKQAKAALVGHCCSGTCQLMQGVAFRD